MAIAVSWTGLADTSIQLDSFLAASHTVVVRFMAHYPDSYEAPFVAENGSGTWAFGMGDYLLSDTDQQTRLMVALGGSARSFPVSIAAGRWYHAAVSVEVNPTLRLHRVFLDGKQLGDGWIIPTSGLTLPSGTLRLARRSAGGRLGGHDAQFYGLLDDVAIFGRALGGNEIAGLAAATHLSGHESGLKTVVVGGGAAPVKVSGAARVVTTTPNRDDAKDRAQLPLPTAQVPMDLPFPPGEAWKVGQAPDGKGGSHRGYACFAWDFDLDGKPQAVAYPGGTNGAPFYASAPGRVARVSQAAASGDGNYSNLVEIEQAPKQICAYLHLRQNSAAVTAGSTARTGELLALTGDTGTGVGNHHLHLAVADDLDRAAGFVTYPVAFRDYEVRQPDGSWGKVSRGMPRTGQVVRNALRPFFTATGSVSVVSRAPDSLDVLVTDSAGQVWRAHWARGTYPRNWDRWRPTLSALASKNAPVHAVKRGATLLDAFITAGNGVVHTGAWDAGAASGTWRGWWDVNHGVTSPGAPVTAISRSSHQLDAFAVINGTVATASWDAHVAGGQWQGWRSIGGLAVVPGSTVDVVSRGPAQLDVFVAGADGRAHTAAWDAGVDGGRWRGWWAPPGPGMPTTTGRVTVVARGANQLDAFLVNALGQVCTAAWDLTVDGGAWQPWRPLPGVVARGGARVAAVSRGNRKLDLVVVDSGGRVQTAAWDATVENGRWQPWRRIGDVSVSPDTEPSLVSRAPDKLDVVVRGVLGSVICAAWDGATGTGDWKGWWTVGAEW